MYTSYDVILVSLSIVVAVMASFVALDLASRVAAAPSQKAARYWLAGGAVSMGIGIWSMHFIGMLALRLPIPMGYDLLRTVLSLAIAISISGFALFVVSRGSLKPGALLGGGLLMGAGIAAMHYTGMGAMQISPAIRYSAGLVALSVLIAVGAAIVALSIAFRLRSRTAWWSRAGAAVIMGVAISGMHYTGMAAAHFAPDSICTVAGQDIQNIWLGGAIGLFSVIFLSVTLLISLFDAHLASRAARFADELGQRNVRLARQAEELSQANNLLGQEIRERSLAERALKQSEESHRLLAENSSDMIVRLTPAGTLTYVSPASFRVLGYEPHELEGRAVPEFIHPEERAEAIRLYEDVVRNDNVNVVTCRLRRRDGGWTWTETSFRAIRDEVSKRTVQVIGVSRNVEERVRVTEALNRFKYVLDNTQDMIYIYDVETLRFSYVNQGAADALGYPVDHLLGKAYWEICTDTSEAEFRKLTEPFLRGETRSRHFESAHRRADGSEMPVDVAMQLVRRPGESGIFISINRDASERKKVDRLKNEFVSTVSHELRTPLTSIRGSLGLIVGGAAGQLSEDALRLVAIAHGNCERLVRLVNDILDIEKIESGKMRFELRPHPLPVLLAQALDATRAYGEQLQVRFDLVGAIPQVELLVDGDRFMQVMSNLLSNAAKFSPSPGVVEVRATCTGAVARISVADHGPGIPEEFRAKIFGKFSQADSTDSRQRGGTGLGLSIAKAIVEKHGGEISFESSLGRGTTFHATFPLSVAKQESQAL